MFHREDKLRSTSPEIPWVSKWQLSRGRECALEGPKILVGGLAPLHLGDRRRE
jgi:hypothetical protein